MGRVKRSFMAPAGSVRIVMCPSRRTLARGCGGTRRSLVVVPVPALAPAPPAARAGLIGSLTGAGCSLLGTFGEGWMGKVCSGTGKVLGVVGKVASNPIVQARRGAGGDRRVGARRRAVDDPSHRHGDLPDNLAVADGGMVYRRVPAGRGDRLADHAAVPRRRRRPGGPVLRARRVRPRVVLLAVGGGHDRRRGAVDDAAARGHRRALVGVAHVAGQDGTQFLSGTSAWVIAGLSLADPFVAVTAGGGDRGCGVGAVVRAGRPRARRLRRGADAAVGVLRDRVARPSRLGDPRPWRCCSR